MSGPFLTAWAVVNFGATLATFTSTGTAAAPVPRALIAVAMAAAVAAVSSLRPLVAATTPTIRPPRVFRNDAETGARLTVFAMFERNGGILVSSRTGTVAPAASVWNVIQLRTRAERIVHVVSPNVTCRSPTICWAAAIAAFASASPYAGGTSCSVASTTTSDGASAWETTAIACVAADAPSNVRPDRPASRRSNRRP